MWASGSLRGPPSHGCHWCVPVQNYLLLVLDVVLSPSNTLPDVKHNVRHWYGARSLILVAVFRYTLVYLSKQVMMLNLTAWCQSLKDKLSQWNTWAPINATDMNHSNPKLPGGLPCWGFKIKWHVFPQISNIVYDVDRNSRCWILFTAFLLFVYFYLSDDCTVCCLILTNECSAYYLVCYA